MAVPFSNTKLRVPKGFQNILECLAREVLRSQPDNIHEFAAAYFEKMLKVRSETGHDPAVHGAKLDDRNYNNEAFKKRSVDPSDPQQQQAAVTIQTQFRQHSAKGEVRTMREEDAATRIQAGFRGFIDREQVRTMNGTPTKSTSRKWPDEPSPAAAEEEEVDIDLNDPEVEKAAIKIQAGFKGFKARKDVHGGDAQKEDDSQQAEREAAQAETEVPAEPEPEPISQQTEEAQAPAQAEGEEEIDIDLEDPEVEKAAVKIQAGFKGLKARKDIKKQKTEEAEAPTTEAAPAEEPQKPAEEEVDIDLNDPETEKAALKIQAGFRGYQTRRDIGDKAKAAPGEGEEEKPAEEPAVEAEAQPQQTQEAPAAEQKEGEEEVDIDLADPDVEKAAVKIQAGFKGFKARKAMSGKKGDEAGDAEAATEGDGVDGGVPAAAESAEVENKPEEEVKPSEEDTEPKQVAGEGEGQETAPVEAEGAEPAVAAEAEEGKAAE